MRYHAPCILAIVLVTILVTTTTAKVKVWHHRQIDDHQDAQFKQTVIGSTGTLKLARQLKRLPGVNAAHIWDLTEDNRGNLYVATGSDGKLFKVTPAGKASVVYTNRGGQILCLATVGNAVYAGTGPDGTIVRIDAQGKSAVVADRLDMYVWSLTVDKQTGTIFAGTGPKGRVWEVPGHGKPAVLYDTRQDHILCLARDDKGMLYAGTDKDGLVYRITPRGTGFVVYSAPQSEVRSLLVTAKGLYAGTSSPTENGSDSATASISDGPLSPLNVARMVKLSRKSGVGKAVQAIKASRSSTIDPDEDNSKPGKPAPSVPAPATGENSLYRIAIDGTVKELFRERAMILTLLRRHNSILAGTGMHGQLFEINEKTRERTELARLDHGQIHCLLRRRDGSIVVGTGDPGRLYILQKDFARKGTIVSDVLDAKILSKWGAVSWRAHTPTGTRVSISFRSGNTSRPDNTWSDWAAEQSQPDTARITCPNARFLQYRLTLNTTNPRHTPEVQAVTLRYATTNHAPAVTSIAVPDLDGKELKTPKQITLKWKATDTNEDELRYNVLVRKEGWKNWICLRENLSKRDYAWDTTTMPSGMYRVKIVASDHRDNPQADVLTGERVSAVFPVAHEAPKVSVRVVAIENGQVFVEARAIDPMVRLTRAEYAVNGKRWENVFPRDGLFDSKNESFRFRLERLTAGNYVLVLRVRDAAGNVGTADVVFAIRQES